MTPDSRSQPNKGHPQVATLPPEREERLSRAWFSVRPPMRSLQRPPPPLSPVGQRARSALLRERLEPGLVLSRLFWG